MTITLSTAVESQGKIIGVLGIDIDLMILSTQLKSIQYGHEGFLYVIEPDGTLLSSVDETKIRTTEPTQYPIGNEISKII